MVNKTEIWKKVKEFEGEYEVSNKGRVRSVKRKRKSFKGTKQFFGQLLKINKFRHKNSFVMLSKNSHLTSKQVHRLVAEAFLPNPKNKPYVIHKNWDKRNNSVFNLSWATASEINKKVLEKRLKKGKLKSSGCLVKIHDKTGKVIKEFPSITIAIKKLKITKYYLNQFIKTGKVKNTDIQSFLKSLNISIEC